MKHNWERTALQIAVGLCSFVPIVAGAYGMSRGVAMLDPHADISGELDGHVRYLSGLLFGIGIAYASAIPRIEERGPRFRLLTLIVFVGGLARLAAYATGITTSHGTMFALTMELVVTPGLALWQRRVAGRNIVSHGQP